MCVHQKSRQLCDNAPYSSASGRSLRGCVTARERAGVPLLLGVLTRESTDAITLRTATLAEIHIPRAEIDELRESPTSIMPQGLETRLSETELRDLLAYLKSLK